MREREEASRISPPSIKFSLFRVSSPRSDLWESGIPLSCWNPLPTKAKVALGSASCSSNFQVPALGSWSLDHRGRPMFWCPRPRLPLHHSSSHVFLQIQPPRAVDSAFLPVPVRFRRLVVCRRSLRNLAGSMLRELRKSPVLAVRCTAGSRACLDISITVYLGEHGMVSRMTCTVR